MSKINNIRPFTRLVPIYGAISVFVVALAGIQVFSSKFDLPAGLTPFVFVLFLLGVLAVGGIYLAWRSSRPRLVLLSLPFVVGGALDLGLGCMAVACSVPAGYTPHLRVFVQWSVPVGLPLGPVADWSLGPAIVMTTEPPPCVTLCTYSIELVPLGFGYALMGVGARALER